MCDNCKLEAVKSRTVVKCKLKFENYAQTRWCTSLMVRVLIEIQFFEGAGGIVNYTAKSENCWNRHNYCQFRQFYG